MANLILNRFMKKKSAKKCYIQKIIIFEKNLLIKKKLSKQYLIQKVIIF